MQLKIVVVLVCMYVACDGASFMSKASDTFEDDTWLKTYSGKTKHLDKMVNDEGSSQSQERKNHERIVSFASVENEESEEYPRSFSKVGKMPHYTDPEEAGNGRLKLNIQRQRGEGSRLVEEQAFLNDDTVNNKIYKSRM